MLDTATAVRFYLTVDEVVSKDEELAKYFTYLDTNQCLSESRWAFTMGMNLNRTLLTLGYEEERKKDKMTLIELSLDNVYKTFHDKVVEPTVDNMLKYNLPSNGPNPYALRIYHAHHEYPAKTFALHEVLMPNKCWLLRKLYIVPPDSIQPCYTWIPR